MAKKSKKSDVVTVIAVLLLLVPLGVLLFKKKAIAPASTETSQSQAASSQVAITIADEPITETDFTGTESVVAGSGPLADAARAYIAQTIASFKENADENAVPEASYEIDIKAVYVPGVLTNSIVISDYEYTGGADGANLYKVFTADSKSGKILSLDAVIPSGTQAAFMTLLKDKLSAWVPDGSDEPVVFPDSVSDLTFSSLTNWSFDDKNLIIYFDQYAIGPGALGAVAFPLPLTLLKGYLAPSY